jgi:hypothetical protein
MLVRGDLKGLCLRVGRSNSFAQPRHESGFILATKNSETTALANLSALVALRAPAPLAFGVCCWRYASLTGYVRDDAASNVLAAIREATVELESFEQ